jgi:putative transcriptional regulator
MDNTRIATLRKQKGLTQAQLGEIVGLTQSMIAYIEAGVKEPSREYKIKIAKYFNVSVEYLFYESYYN